jgi:hypothetical protein
MGGTWSFAWDASDDTGGRVASGVYSYRLTTETGTLSHKSVLVQWWPRLRFPGIGGVLSAEQSVSAEPLERVGSGVDEACCVQGENQ